MIWHKYDCDNKYANPLPPPGEFVWLLDADGYAEVGYWDSGWWCMANGSDDINVLFWGELDYPLPPSDFEAWRDEVYGRYE